MPTIRDYTHKIKSLRNTQKITRTMKMVAASKLRRAVATYEHQIGFHEDLGRVLQHVWSDGGHIEHPLLSAPMPLGNAEILVLTTDKGLCGAFNHQVIRRSQRWHREHRDVFDSIRFRFIGRRGWRALRELAVARVYDLPPEEADFALAQALTDEFTKMVESSATTVFVAFNQFHSPLSQTATVEQLLPVDTGAWGRDGSTPAAAPRVFYEPPRAELFPYVLKQWVCSRLLTMFSANIVGEQGARMRAMDQASTNASDMIDDYRQQRNRVRQAVITRELAEIVSGAEALNV